MEVDPSLPRRVLVVHGVQTGSDAELDQHELIRQLVENRLGGIPLAFDTELFSYEDLNDRAQRRYRRLLAMLVQTPAGKVVADRAFDLIGDVVTSLLDTSTAAAIRKGLRERILAIFAEGNPCYLVAHSLGTIYAFDVLNGLMRERGLFVRDSRRSWPVQGLVTLGSPIGLGLFRKGRTRVRSLGEGNRFFRWVNYWDRTDPVVSGSIFGRQLTGYRIAERYQTDDPRQGWVIRDRAVDTGRVWLQAHTAYWENPVVGDGLVDMIAN